MERPVFSVTQLNRYIKTLFDGDRLLYHVLLRGEISNFKLHYSGHMYFVLKDASSNIRGVMFKGYASRLPFRPENGQKVIVSGRVGVYERDGQYQIYVEDMQPDGIGALHIAYEQLKEKLDKEGLFDQARKKPLPRYPKRVGVVTSPTGAAIRDVINILSRRYPNADVLLYPVLVQGDGAPADIIEAVRYFDHERAADVLIVGRGGGSIEDLWAFNDEGVARAVAGCKIPVISAVGHETDFTIVDFVSDLRAPTPSAAAELAVPSQAELAARLAGYQARLQQAYRSFLHKKRAGLESLANRRVFQRPYDIVEQNRLYLDAMARNLAKSTDILVGRQREHFGKLVSKLDALSPFAVLKRGYLVAQDGTGNLIKETGDISVGDDLKLTLTDGHLLCTVLEKEKGESHGKEKGAGENH